jgi:hypothetical protein
VLRKVCGSKREKVGGHLRNVHVESLHDRYSSPNIIRVIKSRRMTCAVYVARIEGGGGGEKCVQDFVPEI